MTGRTTLGDLVNWEVPPDQEEFFKLIVAIINKFYPETWRSWVVNNLSYSDVFGEKISPDEEQRLRFAIPTLYLAHASGLSRSISEHRYKSIKRRLINSPLGRALIYCPFAIMKKIHPTDGFNFFAENLVPLKNHLISRKHASRILKKQAKIPKLFTTLLSPTVEPSKPSLETAAEAQPECSASNLKNSMENHNNILDQDIEISKQHTSLLSEKLTQPVEGSLESIPPVADSCESNQLVANNLEEQEEEDEEEENGDDDYVASTLCNPEPFLSQTTTVPEVLLDFAPNTMVSENKTGLAEERLIKQGIHCQRLGKSSWQNICYSDVQKQFQATPVFSCLDVNNMLASVTPNWQSLTLLEKMESCLAAITHGLLQQRNHFQDIYDAAPLEIKSYISQNFLTPNSAFRQTSDSLLQYTCGKRTEIIKQRRSIYYPTNIKLKELLDNIPPSSTHLFSEPQLANCINEQGGVDQLLRRKKRTPQVTCETNLTESINLRKKIKPKFNENQRNYHESSQSLKRSAVKVAAANPKLPRFERKA